MIKSQLQSLENVVYRETESFIHLHAEDGYYITDWDREDVKQFSASNCWYLPLSDSYSDFYVIDQSEYDRLIEEQDKALEAKYKAIEELAEQNKELEYERI